jgi:chromosome segregation ATPase
LQLFQALSLILNPTPCHGTSGLFMLHQGTEQKFEKAIVELIIDNSDRRLAFDEDEVLVRRKIGSKEDTLLIQNRPVHRNEWIKTLELAGISTSNPYHIIKQGQVCTYVQNPLLD